MKINRAGFCSLVLITLLFACTGQVAAVQTHTMAKGDTLWDLSAKYYGDPTLYPIFLECNNIQNPRTIPTGKVIVVPSYAELKEIAGELDQKRREKLISQIQGQADSANAASSQSSQPQNTQTNNPPRTESTQKLYQSSRSVNPSDVSFEKGLNRTINQDAIRQTRTGSR